MVRIKEIIEVHPWLRYPDENGTADKLILGSFPPARFTEQFRLLNDRDIDFFYGSSENSFWELFFNALDERELSEKPTPETIRTYLKNNRWAISDIVLQTQRAKPNSAADSDLRVKEYNVDVISDIIHHNPIQVVFFTSRWVQDRFERKIEPCLRNQIFRKITLVSPSSSGLRRLDWAKREFDQNPGESKTDYRLRYYRHYLNQ